MGFDILGLRRAATTLSGKQYELNSLRSALVSYRENISSAWSGTDANMIRSSISMIIGEIDQTKELIVRGSSKMNDAAAKQQIKEAEERAAAEMSKVTG